MDASSVGRGLVDQGLKVSKQKKELLNVGSVPKGAVYPVKDGAFVCSYSVNDN